MDEVATSNVNSFWGYLSAEVLYRLGLRHIVISPGSRSTPLTVAFARHGGVEAISVLDERSAAFYALGLARRTVAPVALVCTSGTAAANYLPAVIEAHYSGVPLLVLTADRPPEMRDCFSGQTVDQQKLYGDYVRLYHEMGLPAPDADRLAYMRQTLVHAWSVCVGQAAGPVHLNCPFRDPLAPSGGSTVSLPEGFDEDAFLAMVEPPAACQHVVSTVGRLSGVLGQEEKGLIICGPAVPGDPAGYAAAVGRLAARTGWPVLADALSPVRQHADGVPGVIAHYDMLLRNAAFAEGYRPRAVISAGPLPTSKALRAWLAQTDCPTWVVDGGLHNVDGAHRRAQFLRVGVEELADAVDDDGARAGTSAFARAWAQAEASARAGIEQAFDGMDGAFEGKAGWIVARHAPEHTPVFIASSMPVRDAEYFWPASTRRLRPYFNRGANGIDGTLSTALGVAHGDRSAILLTGDLALLHDSNGFLSVPGFKGGLTIVMINNNGGGIFENLPVASLGAPFETFFATPQAVDFAKLAQAYGVEYHAIKDLGELVPLVSDLPEAGVRLVEVITDRKRDTALRRALFAEISNAITITD